MPELFTYKSLGTLTGSVMATVLVVEFFKEFSLFKLIHTRWLVLVVAEGIILLTNIGLGSFAIVNIPIYFLNGLLVASSAIGSWQVVHDLISNGSSKGEGGCSDCKKGDV
ncbi:MAG TPA: hypothetical protein GXX19_00615 [Syntrophomonadaceae bacterium]|nr:hypothetical protein [Syntrophomonadaceae bacterium]